MAAPTASAPIEAKLFCAQSLRSKILYDLHQVPRESRLELKDSLIGLLESTVKESKIVSTQLSVALANFSLQALEWKDAVPEMVSRLQQHMTCLLEFLKVLPEEVSDPKRTSLSDDEFRQRTEELVQDNAKKVVELLVNYVRTPESEADHSLVFECLNSWLAEVNVEDIVGTELLDLIFKGIHNEATFEPAVDCVCSVVRETRDTAESMQTIQTLYPKVVALRPNIAACKDDPDAFRAYTRLFSEAGEAWHVLVAKNPTEFRELVECVAECTAFDEDLEVVQFTFYFWYCLKQMLVMPKFVESRAALSDIYLKLIDVVIHHLQYPAGDNENDLFNGDREEEDKFRSFRHEMGDVLKDCCAVVGSGYALQKAYDKVCTGLQEQKTWQEIEAPLFSMRAMAREVELSESEILPNIMKMLVQLPEHEKIRYAATLVLGRYTEWTAKHPDYLDFQLQYITSGFGTSSKSVMSAAAQALMHFCQDCAPLLTGYLEQLSPFYEKVAGELDLDSLYEVTDGIAHVIVAQPEDRIRPALQHFGQPIVNRLLEKCQKPGSTQLYREVADEIELLTILVQIVKPEKQAQQSPTAEFVNELYPVLITTLLDAHGKSSYVSERTCKFIKTCLHSCSVHLSPILPSIAETLVSQFEKTHYGCYLWVSGAVVREFGDDFGGEVAIDAATKEAVWQFSYRQAVTFYRYLSNVSSPAEVPDLIEDFFRLMSDVLMFFPFQHISSDLFEPSFNATLSALTLEQMEPLMATLHFLQDLLGYGYTSPPMSVRNRDSIPDNVRSTVVSLATNNGQQLCARLVSGLIFSFPRDCVTDASSLMLTLFQLVPSQQALEWLSATLNMLPEGSIGQEEKDKLLARVNGAMTSGDFKRVRTLLKDFTALYARRNVTPRSSHLQSLQNMVGNCFSYAN